MTIDALAHPPDFMRQTLQVLNIPVTFPTGNLTVDVALMVEQYMLGYIIHLDPGC